VRAEGENAALPSLFFTDFDLLYLQSMQGTPHRNT
jgi:hypothetical protein